MFALIGAVLVILGILGLVDLIAIGTALSVVLIILGIVVIAWAQGWFGSLRR
jgi:hypothetical protein